MSNPITYDEDNYPLSPDQMKVWLAEMDAKRKMKVEVKVDEVVP